MHILHSWMIKTAALLSWFQFRLLDGLPFRIMLSNYRWHEQNISCSDKLLIVLLTQESCRSSCTILTQICSISHMPECTAVE